MSLSNNLRVLWSGAGAEKVAKPVRLVGGPEGFQAITAHPNPGSEAASDPVASAKAEAKAIVAKAQQEAEAIRARAYEEGYAQGLEEGRAAASAQMKALASNLEAILSSLEKLRPAVLKHLEPEIVGLVQGALEAITRTPGLIPPSHLKSVIAAALKLLEGEGRLTIRLNPGDLQALKDLEASISTYTDSSRQLILVADEELGPGDCVVEGLSAQVDATLAQRREAVFRALEEVLMGGGGLELQGWESGEGTEQDEEW